MWNNNIVHGIFLKRTIINSIWSVRLSKNIGHVFFAFSNQQKLSKIKRNTFTSGGGDVTLCSSVPTRDDTENFIALNRLNFLFTWQKYKNKNPIFFCNRTKYIYQENTLPVAGPFTVNYIYIYLYNNTYIYYLKPSTSSLL